MSHEQRTAVEAAADLAIHFETTDQLQAAEVIRTLLAQYHRVASVGYIARDKLADLAQMFEKAAEECRAAARAGDRID